MFDDPSMVHDYNFTTKHSDVLRAILELEASRRAVVESSMVISPTPTNVAGILPDHIEPDLLAFNLSISIRTTLMVDTNEDIELSQVALEAQRRILVEYYPLQDATQYAIPTVANFISGLQPAPVLPRTTLPEFVQPKGLKCQLYPFQGRTVFWMLGREGFTFSSNGKLIQSTTNEPIRFWEQAALPSGSTRFFNRITGELKKESDIETYPPIRGGILAEEVGCGKTVECISLMLLNPAQKRGPWNVNWNDDAQIPLHEVKVRFSLACHAFHLIANCRPP
jgi:E3 ubiquitin-protein ligase SHPRH